MRFLDCARLVLLALVCLTCLSTASCAATEASLEDTAARWAISAHRHVVFRSFRRPGSDPAPIAADCARCHSSTGYLDFLGADGSTPGKVDQATHVAGTIQCQVCHNRVSRSKDTAVMPSGMVLDGLGRNADCFECHQGRTSRLQVEEAVAGVGADVAQAGLKLPTLHNRAAGPTSFGMRAQSGYEYPGLSYVARYRHVNELDTCITCHDPHSLDVDPIRCIACHLEVSTRADLRAIRTTNVDYDGDGDTSEGIAAEIESLQGYLLRTMQVYASVTEGCEPLGYAAGFENDQGKPYATWTPRLLKAAYNYHYTMVESGNYAHNARYAIQLLYDSLNDLGASTAGLPRPEVNP